MKCLRVLFLTTIQLFLGGCYLNTSITHGEGGSDIPLFSFKGLTSIENVSGTSNYGVTAASGFRVKQSAGMLVNKQLASTQNGYRVYLNVNGRITAGEVNQ